MSSAKKDLLAGLAVVIGMACVLYYINTGIRVAPINLENVNSRSVPNYMAAGCLTLGLILIIKSRLGHQNDEEQPAHTIDRQGVKTVLFFTLLLAAYVILVPYAGFFPVTTCFLALAYWRLGVKWLHSIMLIAAINLVVYVAFVKIIQVPLL